MTDHQQENYALCAAGHLLPLKSGRGTGKDCPDRPGWVGYYRTVVSSRVFAALTD